MRTITIEVPDNLPLAVAASDEDLSRVSARRGDLLVRSGVDLARQRCRDCGIDLRRVHRRARPSERRAPSRPALRNSGRSWSRHGMRVVNASPLIHLARLSLLDLLREPRRSEEVVVPAIVFEEVMKGANATLPHALSIRRRMTGSRSCPHLNLVRRSIRRRSMLERSPFSQLP